MSTKNLYEYVILLHPTEEDRKNGAQPQLLTPNAKLAFGSSDQAVFLQAAREVPQQMSDPAKGGAQVPIDNERIEIVVRPFICGDSSEEETKA